MITDLESRFPILDVAQDCLLSKQGAISMGFALRLPEIFTLSERDYSIFHQAWVKALQSLPPFTLFCKQDWFTGARYAADFSGDLSFADRHSGLFFNQRPYLAHHSYLYLSRLPVGQAPSGPLSSSLFRPNLFPKETLEPAFIADFKNQCMQFKRILEDSGLVSLCMLTESDYIGAGQPGYWERYLSLNPQGSPGMIGDIQLQDGLQIGAQHARMFALSQADQLPEACSSRIDYEPYSREGSKFSLGFASCLGQLLSCDHLYSQYIWIGEPGKTLKRLEKKRRRLQSFSAYSRENRAARDSTEAFLREAVGLQRSPVQAHFNVLVWDENRDLLQEIKNQVASAFAQIDIQAKEETYMAPQLYWAGIPGNAADLPLSETFDTFAEQAACFLMMESTCRESLSPVGLRLGDRLSGRPLHVDLSDEPMKQGICMNRNKFILGPSGSGKSFFTNHMMRSYYEQGAHMVLIDVGHSYKGLCQMLQGYYFTYSEKEPICFNPFYLSQGTRPDTEKKESIKTLLLALWKNQGEASSRSEYVGLSNAITGYYAYLQANPGCFPCFDSFYDFLQKEYRQQLQREATQEKEFDMENFLYVLRPYYRGGEFDFLLNATENLDLPGQRFIVFELDTIKDHPILFPVVTIIIMEVFIGKMRKLKGQRKMILIEEAWKALMTEGFAHYIRYLFKTVRKFYGEAIVVTQEIDDIISSPIVKQTIINNSDCKILLDQSKYQHTFDAIQRLLGLSDKEKALALSVNKGLKPGARYKEVFISLGGIRSQVYRTEVSLEEYLLYTTEEKEQQAVQQYARQAGDLKMGIQTLAQDMRAQQTDRHNPNESNNQDQSV